MKLLLRNEKLMMKVFDTFKIVLETAYFLGFLWVGILLILTIPIWAPLYLLTSSMYRSLNFLKRISELPTELFKPILTEPIRYAILKGNGKYLRGECEDALLFQLYDYTIRKFLSIQQIDSQMKIAEIETQTLSQWKYFKSTGLHNITILQSHPQILYHQNQSNKQIQVKKSDYSVSQISSEYNCMVAFNLKQKLDKYINLQISAETGRGQNVDFLKITAYIYQNLSSNGYAVIGEFFEEEGEIKVMEDLFKASGFNVQEVQNIQKNISYAQKLNLEKVKKFWEENLLQGFILNVKRFFKIKRDYNKKQFVVFILSKPNSIEIQQAQSQQPDY